VGIPGATLSTFARLARLKRCTVAVGSRFRKFRRQIAVSIGKSLLAKEVALFLALIISKMQFTGTGQNCALVRAQRISGGQYEAHFDISSSFCFLSYDFA
jgi:hypothetical protein